MMYANAQAFIKAHNKQLESLRANLNVSQAINRVHVVMEPFWVDLWEKQKDSMRRARELAKKYKTIHDVVKACELQYVELNDYQRRVRNPRTGKFIDWWKGKNQKMLDANGNYTYYTTEKSIVKQILRII